MDKEKILYPPVEKLPEENEKLFTGITEKLSFQDNLFPNNTNEVITDNKKTLKEDRIKEELIKLNLDKKSIDSIILNYSLEDIEEKLDLLQVKKYIINPAGWFIAALQANYLNPGSYKKENYDKKLTKTEAGQPENKVIKPEIILPPRKEKEEINRLSREEELKWIRHIRYNVLKSK